MQQDVLFLIAQRHLGDLRRIDHGVKALRLLAQCGKACRCGMLGSCFQLLHCFKIIFRGGAAQCFQHTARELEGRRGGQHHHGHALALFLRCHMERNGGVGITQIIVLLVADTDLPCHFFLTAPAAGEVLLNGSQRLRTHGVAAVLMTSGTTGTPKPAMLTRSALAASAWSSAQNIALTKHDAWLMSLSVSRIGGLSILTRSLAARSRVVLFPHFCAREFICALKENAVTLASIVPTMLAKLLEEFPDFKPESSLRAILLGGSFASRTLLDDARGRGIPIVTTYGMTETASNVATSAYTERLTLGAKARANTLAELSVQNGTLHVRGPMRMAGYWGHPLLREDAWFDTGDIASLDKDGSLTIYARRTDLIVTGGENVYPAEVENILTRITGIREALVLGLPDKTWGAVVTALLVAQSEPLPEKNLKEALVGKLAPYKRPRRIAWVKHLPVNSAGKLNRNPDALTGLVLSTLHYTR